MIAGRTLAIIATGAMLAAAGAGLWINGSPLEQRERRIDERRVQELAALESAVRTFHDRHGKLPSSLDALADLASRNARDPADGQPYVYRVLDERRFELCARFSHPGGGRAHRWDAGDMSWRHAAGRQCFPREVTESKASVE
jgi:hypothetical protein